MTCLTTAIPKNSFIAPPMQKGAVKNIFYPKKSLSNESKNFSFRECASKVQIKAKKVFDKVSMAFKEFPYKKALATIGACLAPLSIAGHIIFSLLMSISIIFLMIIV